MHDEELGEEIRRRSMVVGWYLPASAQHTSSSRPQATPPVDPVPLPPLYRAPTPPVEFGSQVIPNQASNSPGTPFQWSRSNSPPLRPSTTPHDGRFEEIHNVPLPEPPEQMRHREHEDGDDHPGDDPPTSKRQRKTHTRQKENPITMLTTAIEHNTQVIEEQHRQSYELLERAAGAQQKMFSDLMGALRDN